MPVAYEVLATADQLQMAFVDLLNRSPDRRPTIMELGQRVLTAPGEYPVMIGNSTTEMSQARACIRAAVGILEEDGAIIIDPANASAHHADEEIAWFSQRVIEV